MNHLRRPQVSVYIAASLDGFIATRNNGLDWLEVVKSPDGDDYGYTQFMKTIDALILGRTTYDVVRGFGAWPYESKDVTVLTHRAIEPIANERAASGALFPVLEQLHERGIRRVYLDGGQAVQQGLKEDVVDDLTVSVIPILLGDGIPLFGRLEKTIKLEQVRSKPYETGLVQLEYRVSR